MCMYAVYRLEFYICQHLYAKTFSVCQTRSARRWISFHEEEKNKTRNENIEYAIAVACVGCVCNVYESVWCM